MQDSAISLFFYK